MPRSELSALRTLINNSLDVYEAELDKLGLQPPGHKDATPHLLDDPTFLPTPELYESRRTLVGKSTDRFPIDHLYLLIIFSIPWNDDKHRSAIAASYDGASAASAISLLPSPSVLVTHNQIHAYSTKHRRLYRP